MPYSRKEFGVPDNIYLLGTMNTADRSLTGLDIALRRRFAFKKMPPRPDLLSEMKLCNSGFSLADVLSVLNRRIAALLDQDHCIGHAPFLALPKGNVPIQSLAAVFRDSVLPLLEEYFFDDWNKIRLVLNDHRKEDTSLRFIDAAEENRDLFGHDVEAANEEWTLNEDAFYQTDSYVQIIDAKRTCPKDSYALQEETNNNAVDGSGSQQPSNGSSTIVQQQPYGNYNIVRYDSDAVEVYKDGIKEPSAIKILKTIAKELGVSTLSSVGTPLNTRTLGRHVLDHLEQSSRT